MRTTVNLDDDVAAAVDRLRRTRHIGLSEAVNELARAGLRNPAPEGRFRQRTVALGVGLDVRDIGDALEIAEGPEHR